MGATTRIYISLTALEAHKRINASDIYAFSFRFVLLLLSPSLVMVMVVVVVIC